MAYQCVRSNKECDGCGNCEPPETHYYCPICDEEVYENVFVNIDGEVIGCENCVETKEPYEVLEYEID